jgi:2-octaprenyl-6-methoxyphenol hydroxylase
MSARELNPVVIVGGGPAGLAAALALGRHGFETVLAGPNTHTISAKSDRRTAALFTGSIALLRHIGVWDAVAQVSAPITGIRIVDDREVLLKAPEALFTAAEVGLEVFGYNVPNDALAAALLERARAPDSRVSLIDTAGATTVEASADHVRVVLSEGIELRARLVVGADGRNSLCRSAADIATHAWTYPQSAIACTFSHTRAHRNISTEFHREYGPFTVVPMPGNVSSLVWVEDRDEAQRIARLDNEAFRAALETRLHGLLGSIEDIGPLQVFPLSGLSVESYGARRIALVGEAAHVIPPIGAQGLNLGLRDAACLADCVADAMHSKRDLGDPRTLADYTAARATDVGSRIWAVDILNRSLLAGILPIDLARGAGLFALKIFGPLRRFMIREGLQPSQATPSLMRS